MMECKLCKALKNEKDDFLYEDVEIVILPTKNKKGHNKRIMVISKEHIKEPDDLHERLWTEDFVEFCKDYFDEEPTFALCESTYASIPDHWHKIACDWKSDDKEEMKQLIYTPHQAVRTHVRWEP